MNGLALFAGYGGLELGIDAAFGHVRTVCYVERESYAAATLVARMEESSLHKAPIWDDVTTFDGRPWRGTVDIISAGFPCQPFSAAGKQRGTADERWLWDDIARIIREVRPRFFVGENVPGLVRLGLDPVLRSFAEMGYDVSWGAFRADEVGAAHRRERVFILAQRRDCVGDSEGAGAGQAKRGVRNDSDRADWELANATKAGRRHRRDSRGMDKTTKEEKGFRHKSAQAADDSIRDVADDHGERGRQGCGTAETRSSDAKSRGEELADAQGTGLQERQHARHGELSTETGAGLVNGVERQQRQLADAGCELLEGRHKHGTEVGQEWTDEGVGQRRTAVGRLFAPGPADLDLWARVLAEAPSLEPSLCRMADGSAEWLDHRQDRLRACGNGVVPLQAAVAIRVLADRAGWII